MFAAGLMVRTETPQIKTEQPPEAQSISKSHFYFICYVLQQALKKTEDLCNLKTFNNLLFSSI